MTSYDEIDLIAAQLRAIDAWHRAKEMAASAERAAGVSREMRMDLNRRMEVLRVQQTAIIERTEAHLQQSVHLLATSPAMRAVVVHRNAWFTEKLCAGLVANGVEVVARLDNGAHAIGAAIAEQPDLLLVEDVLAMVPGVEVVREVHELAPHTRIGAHVEDERHIGEMLDAGAHAAWSRRVPPADVIDGLLALCRDRLQHA